MRPLGYGSGGGGGVKKSMSFSNFGSVSGVGAQSTLQVGRFFNQVDHENLSEILRTLIVLLALILIMSHNFDTINYLPVPVYVNHIGVTLLYSATTAPPPPQPPRPPVPRTTSTGCPSTSPPGWARALRASAWPSAGTRRTPAGRRRSTTSSPSTRRRTSTSSWSRSVPFHFIF